MLNDPDVALALDDGENALIDAARRGANGPNREANDRAYGETGAIGKAPTQAQRDEDWKKNPFNINGDKWDWAPWNQNKKPQTENNEFPGESETVPFNFPPGQNPIQFRVNVNSTLSVYGTPSGQTSASYQYSYDVGANEYYVGVPEYLRVQRLANTGYSVWIKMRDQAERNVHGIELGPIQSQGSYSRASGPTIKVEGIGDRLPWPRTNDVEIPQSEQLPQPELEPLAPPQYQPTGYPELPIPPVPYPSPQPLPNLRPSPAPNRRPSPDRDPKTQPTPFPKPTVDPTAPPTTQPNTEPSPFPSIQPNPNPGPLVKPQPQPQPSFAPSGSPNRSPNATTDKLKEPDVLTDRQPQINIDIGLPAPEVDLCKDPCMADMHDTSKGQKPKSINYKVFKKCGANGPEFETKTISVPADTADSIKILLDDAADRKGEKCTPTDCYAAMPDSHELRLVGIPPQLVIQYAEQLPGGKFGAPKYSISIPYYRYSEADTTANRFPTYTKGQRFGVLVLPDNAKLIINAISEAEVNRVLKQLELLIDKGKLKGAITSNNARRGQDLKQIKVAPRIAKYFTGGKNAKPEWIKYF